MRATKFLCFSWVVFSLAILVSCSSLDPRKPDAAMPETKPHAKITNYTQALNTLGLMTEIYGSPAFKIQSNPIGDNTGSSAATGAEIPRDITEIMKSVLNSIGGKVTFIPYDPSFIQNQTVTGYSNFHNKLIPDVVLTGGITEFDRGLETRGETTDASGGAEINGGLPGDMPGKDLELRYSASNKSGLARITLDFNLLDFQTMTGIPKMNTTNSMEVHKVQRDRELGVSLFGQSFGGKGSLKKVQGRHAAVRLLVELSMIQIVGKYLRLPYWRLLGDDAKPDPFVMDQLAQNYRVQSESETIAAMQDLLFLYGFNVDLTGTLDEPTLLALKSLHLPLDPGNPKIDFKTYTYVYLNVPLTEEANRRRTMASWK